MLVVPVGAGLIRNTPEERGLHPLGAAGPAQSAAQAAAARQAGRVSVSEAAQTLPFWLLMSTFFVCGYTSNGLVLTQFMPHALEHNFPAMQASAAPRRHGRHEHHRHHRLRLALREVRPPRSTGHLLLRAWHLAAVPALRLGLHLWAAIFGLNYISPVPPTTTFTANIYGRFSVGELAGWIFFAHQVGAALGAALVGWIFGGPGSYSSAFVSAALMAFLAAGLTMMIREEPVRVKPVEAAFPRACSAPLL